MPIIEIKNLTKKYDSTTAVDGISLEIEEGEIFGLLGPNGSGKTTTLSMLSTLLPPTAGSATVNGYDLTRQPAKVRHSIGFVFQDPSSDDLLTRRENLYLHALMYGVKDREINQRIEEALKLVDLTDRQHVRMRTYSGGMRRRLELARGFLHRPKILFLDEPTLGLDPQTREGLWKYIKQLSTENKITIILTTHYMEEAEKLCDRIAIINQGKIIAMDTPHNFKKSLGGDLVTIQTKNPDVAGLKNMTWVKRVQYQNELLSLTVDEAGSHLKEILEKAGDVKDVELHSPTLHDVFLKLTGKKIREGSSDAEGGWYTRMVHSGNK